MFDYLIALLIVAVTWTLLQKSWSLVCIPVGAGLFLLSLLLGPRVMVATLACGLASIYFNTPQMTYRRSAAIHFGLAGIMAVPLLLSYGILLFRLEAWRDRYPNVDLSTRLASLTIDDSIPANSDSDASYTDILKASFNRRNVMLTSLNDIHFAAEREFHYREGFGVGRMLHYPLRGDIIEIPDVEPVAVVTSEDTMELPQTPAAEPRPLNHESLFETHVQSFGDFLSLPRMGGFSARGYNYFSKPSESPRVVRGFQPHAMTTVPRLPNNDWKIVELELVSLLKGQPAVYNSTDVPNLKTMSHEQFPRRPLDDFETQALERLKEGSDFEKHVETHEIRMLGSIRSVEQCVSCHQVEPGTLLGAFTYRLKSRAMRPAGQTVSQTR